MAQKRSITGMERRYHGRVPGYDIACSGGRVIDISRSGVGILTRWPWGSVRSLTFAANGCTVKVRVERVRARCIGLMRFIVAYRFIGPPPDLFQRIVKISPTSFDRRVI